MGWKNVKDYYRIGHQVEITMEGICIGSPLIHNIIVIGAADGVVNKRYDMSRANEDLLRYQMEMDADPEKLRELVQSPDSFSAAVTVYTYSGAEIIKKRCETLGWPNVTHDGDMMYENTFSTDKLEVVGWAKENAAGAVALWDQQIEEVKKRLADCRAKRSNAEGNLDRLMAEYQD